MLHTICLFKRLSLSEYKKLDTALPKHSRRFPIEMVRLENNTAKYELNRYGFAHFYKLAGVSMYLTKKKTYLDGLTDTRSYLHVEVNPKAILNKDYISVANELDATFALHEIHRLFHRMGTPLSPFDFLTNRLDCCYNALFTDRLGWPSDEIADEVLELAFRGKVPDGFKRDEWYYDNKTQSCLP